VRNGAWSTSMLAGSTGADALTRAKVAIYGILALDPKEAIYYVAGSDDDGRPLAADREYEVRGGPLPGRWWSVTAYDKDNFLIPNEGHRYAYSSQSIAYEPDGGFVIRVGHRPRNGNWLPTGEGHFRLTLRLYNAPESVRDDRTGVALPRIVRVEAKP
jgi:hypothetical protein